MTTCGHCFVFRGMWPIPYLVVDIFIKAEVSGFGFQLLWENKNRTVLSSVLVSI